MQIERSRLCHNGGVQGAQAPQLPRGLIVQLRPRLGPAINPALYVFIYYEYRQTSGGSCGDGLACLGRADLSSTGQGGQRHWCANRTKCVQTTRNEKDQRRPCSSRLERELANLHIRCSRACGSGIRSPEQPKQTPKEVQTQHATRPRSCFNIKRYASEGLQDLGPKWQ